MARIPNLKTLLAAGLIGIAGAAAAQTAMEAGPDKDFVAKANVGNVIEIETSKLAMDKATTPALKAFARQMADDHAKAQAALEKAVRDIGGPELSQSLDGSHMQMLDALSKRQGPEFDKLYIDDQTALHDSAAQVLTDYARQGGVPALKTYAERTLPVVEEHRAHIKTLAASNP